MAEMISEPLDPDTAPEDRSIWQNIDRVTFERQTEALSMKDHVAGPRSYAQASAPNDDSLALPLELERSLADDLAFIAACQPHVDFVSAVAIEQDLSKPAFVVKLAVNEGVSLGVQEQFDEIFAVLRSHARKDITRECCQEQLFQLILRLNRNKILGRLGSTKFSPPTHLVKSPDPLPTRVQNLVRNSIKARTTRRDREIERLYGQIDSFQATFRRLENGKAADVIPNIAFAIKQAYELTKDEVKLPDRLKALGCSHAMDARAVRDVGKVSNYLRVSRHLAICSQRYRPCFANAEWHPVPNYNASSRSRVLPRQHVHAEIQLLVYYEISTPQSAPRAIGASKEACFLCDSFIRAHGRFSITGAHRQMFPLWTVPDLKEYALPTIQRFRQALSLVHADVKEETLKARKKYPWRPFPPQSTINLNVVQLLTPSTSALPTVSESHSNGDGRIVTSPEGTTTPIPNQAEQVDAPKHRGGDGVGHAKSAAPSTAELHAHINNDPGNAQMEVPIEIAVDEAVARHTDWVHVSASFSRRPNDELPTPQQGLILGGSVSLEPPTIGRECGRTFHAADIPSDRELVLERDADDDRHQLSLVVIGSLGESIRIRCRWLVS